MFAVLAIMAIFNQSPVETKVSAVTRDNLSVQITAIGDTSAKVIEVTRKYSGAEIIRNRKAFDIDVGYAVPDISFRATFLMQGN